eukprot:TRINITY_DN1230_c0_g1_i4.p1 TRINITY_DN1230_c0_g1~~TRINITY_DN1230_c0_g1_i4.p1  ORF type:complete len:205 (-),score=58.52 TRINITY_DN1230_c0_g1_i4:315-884(-)
MGRVVPAMMRLPTLLFLLVSVSYEDSPLRSNTSKARACYEWEVEYHGGGLENPMVTGVSDADQCQQLCQGRQGCNYFTWLSSQHEFSGYRNTCWLKSTQGTPQACKTCVSGPRSCGGNPTNCCETVTISSSGNAHDYQWTRLGTFRQFGTSDDGRPIYRQDPSSQNYLYYLDWLGVWYVTITFWRIWED